MNPLTTAYKASQDVVPALAFLILFFVSPIPFYQTFLSLRTELGNYFFQEVNFDYTPKTEDVLLHLFPRYFVPTVFWHML